MAGSTPIAFKTRVKEDLFRCAEIYGSVFIGYEYLICSRAFKTRSHYIFYATSDNFLHLTGLNTCLRASEFFKKCLNHTLIEDDFDFLKPEQDEKSVKSCVKRKLKVLKMIDDVIKPGVLAEEEFSKGKVHCSFATATGSFTLGFVTSGKSRPKTLLEGNYLKNPEKVDLILRKPVSSEKFTEMILGTRATLRKHLSDIEGLMSETLLQNV